MPPQDSPLVTLDDGALARRIAAAGRAAPDRAAEDELCRRLGPRIRLYGLRHLRDPNAAADLVQQVLLLALERLRDGTLREPERVASFVLGSCRMTVLDLRRGTRRRERLLDTWGDATDATAPFQEESSSFDSDRLAHCLESLPERERSVVVLSFFADKSADDVGTELSLSAGNVRVIRHRALTRLRGCLDAGEVDR